ncbi:ribosome hibernation factor-recruiting GTPase MRF [Jongsikchunia kroppenstedtii]|uniref:ribosome hibernation factor-recruiting GTPase MRF n=1 Tax=Jongsikchunia kroppenstedtii TaxID=1121721 RepID=UPI000688A0B8|nr:GTP-binding protein [Jongsikchunia kroppenstedtii]
MSADNRVPVILVAGLDGSAVGRVTDGLLAPGTVAVRHDLGAVAQGVVVRTVRVGGPVTAGADVQVEWIDLDHGCVSCTLEHDLLPFLRRLARREGVDRIVLELDPAIEPEPLCFAVNHHVVADMVGYPDAPAGADVRIQAVIACVDVGSWLAHAGGDETLVEAGLIAEDADERTLAQVVVGQVDFADAIVASGTAPSRTWDDARTFAALGRLNPVAPMLLELPERPLTRPLVEAFLEAVPADARRGRVFDAHEPLLRGQPPLTSDCGVQLVEFVARRPFHPERLHEAIDVLLEGVISARGRLWVASQPDEALWLESAGGGLRVAAGGRWLAAMSDVERQSQDAGRRVLAEANWDPVHGDRHTYLLVLAHQADPEIIRATLAGALLTDVEYALGQRQWLRYSDPFGQFHEEPCSDTDSADRQLFDQSINGE